MIRYSHTLALALALGLSVVATHAQVRVGGAITTDTSWTSDNVYHVTNNLTVAVGAKLTVAAGTVVKFGKNYALYVQGALSAQGTAGNKIYFTSIDDPTVGGSAGGDGSPSSTDWQFIEFQDSSVDGQCLLEHCVIRYGGYISGSGNYHIIRCINASPTIRNCQISDCRGGLYGSGGASPLVLSNSFAGSGSSWCIQFDGLGQPTIGSNVVNFASGINVSQASALITNNVLIVSSTGIGKSHRHSAHSHNLACLYSLEGGGEQRTSSAVC